MSQEIETTLDESSVTAGAKPAEPQPKLGADGSSLAGVQDLGGPTPQNSKPTDDSNKYKTIAGGNAASPTTKPSDASGAKAEFAAKGDVKAGHEPEGDVIAEEPQETVIEVDLSADVAALTEGEELTEEFKEKAKTILEVKGIPYIGSSAQSSARAFDKGISAGLVPTGSAPQFVVFPQSFFREMGAPRILKSVISGIGLPLIVKPINGGSAFGVRLCASVDQVAPALVDAFGYGDRVMLQSAVIGTELAVTVIEVDGKLQALPPVEVVPVSGD